MINEFASNVDVANEDRSMKDLNSVDISKRIDVERPIIGLEQKNIDISKRIEPNDIQSDIAQKKNKFEPQHEVIDDHSNVENKQEEQALESSEKIGGKLGGSYQDVKTTSDGETHEVHHMPADSVSNLERVDGPAIKMEKEDHHQTASYGNSTEAREYREKQKQLIEQGNFKEALQMDIDDLHEKFGDKYDGAIEEMLGYVNKLEEEGKI